MNLLPGKWNPEAVPRTWSAVCGGVPVLAALVAVFLLALPARADDKADYQEMVYSGPGLCVHGESELVRHDTAVPGVWNVGFYPIAVMGIFSSCTGAPSTYNYTNWPAGWLALREQLLVWSGSGWGICDDSGYYYNNTPAAYIYYQSNNGYGPHPCGVGFYGLFTSFFAWDGSTWRGGSVWSGYLYSL